MINEIRKFYRDCAGNVAFTLGILLMPLLGAAAYGVDYSIMFHQKMKLQDVADAAALASVKELSLSGSNDTVIERVAESYAVASLGEDWQISSEQTPLQIEVESQKNEGKISVNLSFVWKPFIAHVFDSSTGPSCELDMYRYPLGAWRSARPG